MENQLNVEIGVQNAIEEYIGSKVLPGRNNIVSLDEIGCQIKILLNIQDTENSVKIAEFVADAINEKIGREKNRKHPKKTISEIRFDTKLSTEELFNITPPPDYICSYIGKVKKGIQSMCEEKLSIEEIELVFKSIEILRKQCEDIRFWGNQWKILAKRLIEERDGFTDLMDNKFLK